MTTEPSTSTKGQNNFQSNALTMNSHKSTKHVLLLKSDESNGAYSEQAWSEVVKKKLPKQIPNIPVNQAKLTKQGCGYLSFPDQKSRDNAADNLKSIFKVESKDNTPKLLSPNIKICGLTEDDYPNTTEGLQQLKEDIIRKNEAVCTLVETQGKQFDILFTNYDKSRNESFVVAKIDASIRKSIQSTGDRLFIELSSCKVLDRIHVTQCHTCQAFGHKQNSRFCSLKDQSGSICRYCSENHLSKDCSFKKDVEVDNYKCSNCARSNSPAICSKAKGHFTTSNKCPILQQEAKAIANRTVGMDSKNSPLPYVIVT